jgi:hypothetical protein
MAARSELPSMLYLIVLNGLPSAEGLCTAASGGSPDLIGYPMIESLARTARHRHALLNIGRHRSRCAVRMVN